MTARPNRVNAAKTRSIKSGADQKISGTTYRGSNAIYFVHPLLQSVTRTKAGIPWVRTSLKKHEIKRMQKGIL